MNLSGQRICLVGPLPPPAGGMANQTRQLADSLVREGLDVILVQTNKNYRPAWVAKLSFIRAFFRLIPYLVELWQAAGESRLLHVMSNSGWSWHLCAAPAIWIGKLRNKPVIVNYHGGEAEAFLARSLRVVRCTMQQATTLTVPSGYLQDVFGRFGFSAVIVPNTVDLSCFNDPEPRQVDRRHILVTRNLEPIYDNETAIRAFAIVHGSFPDARLTITGSGPQADYLRSLAGNLGLEKEITFTGRLDRNEIAKAYRKADIALNPSLIDNMPVSIMEAMASGVPVVTTNVGGIPYIVQDETTALLIPPKSPEAMAAAIIRLMNDRLLSEKMVANGLQESQKYTWEKVWPKLADVYCRACGFALSTN